MNDGRLFACRVAPMPHGATLVTFTHAAGESSGAQPGQRALLIG